MLMVVFRPRLLHLRNWNQPDVAAEPENVTAGKPVVARPLMSRASSNRNLQLFR